MGKQDAIVAGQKKRVYFGLVVYKNEKDLQMAFTPDLVQSNVTAKCKSNKTKTDDNDEDYLLNLYDSY